MSKGAHGKVNKPCPRAIHTTIAKLVEMRNGVDQEVNAGMVISVFAQTGTLLVP